MNTLFNWEVRYSNGMLSGMKNIIQVVATIESVKTLLVKLTENNSSAIAFLEKDGETLFTLSYWECNKTFHAKHFNGLDIRAFSMREYSRERSLEAYNRKREKRIIGAEKYRLSHSA